MIVGLMLFGCEKPTSNVETVTKADVEALRKKAKQEHAAKMDQWIKDDLERSNAAVDEETARLQRVRKVEAAKRELEATKQELEDTRRAYGLPPR